MLMHHRLQLPASESWLNDDMLRCVRHAARSLTKRLGRSPVQRDDLEQDLLLHLWQRWGRFDPARARQTTFVRRLLRNRAATILRDERRKIRRTPATCSLHYSPPTMADEADSMPQPTATSEPCVPARRSDDLAADVADVVERLPSSLQVMCDLLSIVPAVEVRRRLRLSRHAFDKLASELREQFAAAGFDAKF